MIDEYYRADRVLYVIIAVIGAPVNLLAIVIFCRRKCGLATCTSHYLVAMAVGDLLVIINEVIFFRINHQFFPLNFLDLTPVCRLIQVLTNSSTNLSVWFTVAFTFDRFIAICSQKLKTKICTGKTAAAVVSVISVLIVLKNVPHYFTREPWFIYNNVAWGCKQKANISQEIIWLAWDWFATFLSPLFPFAIILLLNALTVRHILVASRVRKGLRGQENQSDPEMESRRRSIVLLFTLSGTFIILWLTTVSNFFYSQARGPGREDNDSEIIFNNVGHLLRNISCCINTFIYAATQSKFRKEMKSAVTYPVNSVLRLIKKINN